MYGIHCTKARGREAGSGPRPEGRVSAINPMHPDVRDKIIIILLLLLSPVYTRPLNRFGSQLSLSWLSLSWLRVNALNRFTNRYLNRFVNHVLEYPNHR